MKYKTIVGISVLILIVLLTLRGCASSQKKTIQNATNQIDTMAINMFNQKFQGYEGTQKSANIKELISVVITSNETDYENEVFVTMSGGTPTKDSTELSTMRSGVTNGKTYTVTFDYTNGVVSKITIK